MGSLRQDDRGRWLRRLLIGGFVAALLPVLPGELRYHGDERFYTDGAMHMLQSGDYLTPAYADGRPRFLKPGLSYWLIAGSYQTLGVGLAASRLPSLLAGAGVLWLAGRAVLALGGSESASFLQRRRSAPHQRSRKTESDHQRNMPRLPRRILRAGALLG